MTIPIPLSDLLLFLFSVRNRICNIPGKFVKIEDVLIDVENILTGVYDKEDESKFLFIGDYHGSFNQG